ncbi:hypothetical protein [Photobacterium leiognathi]|uniref:hypothetical protein n=1 Tax=Photobacterium leiognathi TaxID=553611 RepID=UPI0027390A30|nr:hypothetical protein [Photobacterium leiognathi]
MVVIHQKFLADRNLSGITALVLSVICILLFLVYGTQFPIATSSFISISILCTHDAIACGIWANKVANYFYGNEADLANETYITNESVLMESIVSIKTMKEKKSQEL